MITLVAGTKSGTVDSEAARRGKKRQRDLDALVDGDVTSPIVRLYNARDENGNEFGEVWFAVTAVTIQNGNVWAWGANFKVNMTWLCDDQVDFEIATLEASALTRAVGSLSL